MSFHHVIQTLVLYSLGFLGWSLRYSVLDCYRVCHSAKSFRLSLLQGVSL